MKTNINWSSVYKEVIISLFIVFSITGTYAALSSLTATTGESLTATKWNDLVNHATPSGAIIPFNLSSCPTGWSAADGTGGNPDLRGEFIRGWDNGRGVDSGRTLATYQPWAIENIVGEISRAYGGGHAFVFSGAFSSNGDNTGSGPGGGYTSTDILFDASNVVNTADETRPRNVALLYCIKD